MLDHYKIEGTSNICKREVNGSEYNTSDTWPTFQEDVDKLKKLLIDSVVTKTPLTFVRIGDAELYFTQGKSTGNIPRRHCSKKLTPQFIKKFKDGISQFDYVSTSLYKEQVANFVKNFPSINVEFPLEMIYGLVASRWIFKQFGNKIGLIGGTEKIKMIKELMKYKEYREYIGTDCFADYISIREKFCCDDTENLTKQIGEKLQNSKAEIFLYGMGIAKLAIVHKLKEYKSAIYLDVGCGISALAGTTSLKRPYFGSWTNYLISGYNYNKMDRIDYNSTKGKNEIILPNYDNIINESINNWKLSAWAIDAPTFKLITKTIPYGSTLLELGSGEGTGLLSKIYKMISIEDDKKWVGKYNSQYIYVPLLHFEKGSLEHFPKDPRWYNPEILKNKLKDIKYDAILIDGPKGFRGSFYKYSDLFDLSKILIFDDTQCGDHKKLALLIAKKTGRDYVEHKCAGKKEVIVII